MRPSGGQEDTRAWPSLSPLPAGGAGLTGTHAPRHRTPPLNDLSAPSPVPSNGGLAPLCGRTAEGGRTLAFAQRALGRVPVSSKRPCAPVTSPAPPKLPHKGTPRSQPHSWRPWHKRRPLDPPSQGQASEIPSWLAGGGGRGQAQLLHSAASPLSGKISLGT